VINLGDWIDLEGGLTVEAYNGEGGVSYSAAEAVRAVTWTFTDSTYYKARNAEPRGTRCRLIVVGINSFHSGKGTDGKYTVPANDSTPHVVFQFQNIPVKRRMNATGINTRGYAASDMRKYLTVNFLAGLKGAGVPVEETDGVLWAPVRYVSTRGDTGDFNKIKDLVWLPTEREMFEGGISTVKGVTTKYGPYSVATDETASNQARLEYYCVVDSGDPNDRWAKFWTGTDSIDPTAVTGFYADRYWVASPYSDSASFCRMYGNGITGYCIANDSDGCVPAFCVK
jgi:hypothetical protein